ncbi:MAG: hypothetical protein FE78DRAFT_32845 [Acidomyces sp. 'richmondensis']|nr:MAG: hypothetical protein FE78DRAFT_32845 [Acidomyces sp. 'richmondensis']
MLSHPIQRALRPLQPPTLLQSVWHRFFSRRSALIVQHLQNDLVHPEGIWASRDCRNVVRPIRELLSYPGFNLRVGTTFNFSADLNRSDEVLSLSEEIRRSSQGSVPVLDSRHRSWGQKWISGLDDNQFDLVMEKAAHPIVYKDAHDNLINPSPGPDLSFDLLHQLRSRGITDIVLTGLAGDGWVADTARDAVALGFNVFIVEDCLAYHNEEDWQLIKKDLMNKGVRIVRMDDADFEPFRGTNERSLDILEMPGSY